MKKTGLILMAVACICSCGFFKKGKDGSYSIDTSEIDKQASNVTATANAEIDKASKKSEEYKAKTIAKIKAEAEKVAVSKEEVLAELEKPVEDIKTKAAALDPAKLTAYLYQYSHVIADSQAKVADYTQQVKDLKFTQKFSKEGKELKAQLDNYTTQFNDLSEQASVYLNSLKGFGLDPAALGIDLSAYGL